jgi:RND family efflux transporter MFP subunit
MKNEMFARASFWMVVTMAAIGAACSSTPTAPKAEKTAAPERVTESTTDWTKKTELFLEFPALVAGEGSRFAIHLTRLDNFHPVAAGRCEVELAYEGGGKEVFSTDGPSKAGIFGVTVKPAHAGKAAITIRLTAPGLADAHSIGAVPVFAALRDAPTEEPPAIEETIPFLKEQQWALDFATELAGTARLQESLEVPAEVTPRSGGEAVVIAPIAGRLAGEAFPVYGTLVQKGQVLARVLPLTPTPGDRAALDLAKTEAEVALDYIRRDRERAGRLVAAGAAPRRRLEEVVAAERTAEARLQAANQRIRMYAASSSADAAEATAFLVRAPISGTIVESNAASGVNLRGNETLFKIADTARIYVSAIVPEADFPRIRSLTGAEIAIPGVEQPRAAGRRVATGKIIDAATRTFPVVYEFLNADGRIAINQTVTMRLLLAGAREGVVVPEGALVDDAGRPVVFVQREGEAFSRRPVAVGRRQNGRVEILSGVKAGERVVTRCAYLIRLSSMSSQIPAHGHVH